MSDRTVRSLGYTKAFWSLVSLEMAPHAAIRHENDGKQLASQSKTQVDAGDGGRVAGFLRFGFPGSENILRSMCEVWAGLPCDSEPPKPTASHQARLLNICGIAGVFTPIMISHLRRSEGGVA